ncbi:hypothetical protein AAE478_010644 [Parahypoxylon ruwenzoriense]
MRVPSLLAVLLAPPGPVAAPVSTLAGSLYTLTPPTKVRHARQGVVTPPPCVALDPPPSEEETHAKFVNFADAFMVKRNLTNAFEYISSLYINHNPYAEDGPDAALDVLGKMWNSTKITPLRTAFKGDQGWLNYEASGVGEIIDRYRWEAGCIAEHDWVYVLNAYK